MYETSFGQKPKELVHSSRALGLHLCKTGVVISLVAMLRPHAGSSLRTAAYDRRHKQKYTGSR